MAEATAGFPDEIDVTRQTDLIADLTADLTDDRTAQ
jgi:hypothetical protein